jgi:hypothetical protein
MDALEARAAAAREAARAAARAAAMAAARAAIPKNSKVQVTVGEEKGGVAFYNISADFQKESVDKRYSEFEKLYSDLSKAGVNVSKVGPHFALYSRLTYGTSFTAVACEEVELFWR